MNIVHSIDLTLAMSQGHGSAMHDQPPRRRTMNPAAKRAAILLAATELFADPGYDRTSIADIARKADVAVGSVYRLFADKRAVLAAVHNAVEDEFIAAILEGWRTEGTIEARMAAIATGLFATAARLSRIVMVLSEQRFDGAESVNSKQRTVHTIAQIIEEGISQNLMRDTPPLPTAEIGYGIVSGAMAGCFMREVSGNPELYTRLVARTLFDLIRK
jgi:AcrR family transcriptional regulator